MIHRKDQQRISCARPGHRLMLPDPPRTRTSGAQTVGTYRSVRCGAWRHFTPCSRMRVWVECVGGAALCVAAFDHVAGGGIDDGDERAVEGARQPRALGGVKRAGRSTGEHHP